MSIKFLVIGASSGTGLHLVETLLAKSFEVGIVVRNPSKAKDVFKSKFDSISKVIKYEFGVSTDSTELEKGMKWCDVLVSAIGSCTGRNPQVDDYESIREMVRLFGSEKVDCSNKRFIMVSSMLITRPVHFISLLLNTLAPYVLGWKALAENELRKSKINYLIVRPGQLLNVASAPNVSFSQGDRITGKISRQNLASTILDLAFSKDVTKRATIEVSETKEVNQLDMKSIKEDTDKEIITADHFNTTVYLQFVIYSLLFAFFCYIITWFK